MVLPRFKCFPAAVLVILTFAAILSDATAQPLTASDKDLLRAAEQESSDAARERTRRVILKHFPDLSGPALDGWIDSYESLPAAQLEVLLRQKKLLPGIVPRGGLMMDLPEISVPADTKSTFQAERAQAMDNLRHWNSAGYRRWRVCQIPVVSSPEQKSNELRWVARRDFQSARLLRSDSPVHLAISGDPDLMFRLEGNVVTRLGAFVRTEEGLLALPNGKEMLRLVPEVRVPPEARSISFGKDGQVIIHSPGGPVVTEERLTLHRIPDLQALKSSNGILFQVSEAAAEKLEAVRKYNMHANSLEASNVDHEEATATFRQLEFIRELSADIP